MGNKSSNNLFGPFAFFEDQITDLCICVIVSHIFNVPSKSGNTDSHPVESQKLKPLRGYDLSIHEKKLILMKKGFSEFLHFKGLDSLKQGSAIIGEVRGSKK